MISQRLANPGGGLENHHVGSSVANYDLSFDCNPKKFDMLVNNWLDDDQGRDEGQDVRVFFCVTEWKKSRVGRLALLPFCLNHDGGQDDDC